MSLSLSTDQDLPAEHGDAFAVIPARGPDGSERDSSPERRHAPLPRRPGLQRGRLRLQQMMRVGRPQSRGGRGRLVVPVLRPTALREKL